MKREDRRRAHLLSHLDRYNEDVEFLREVNERLSLHPDYTNEQPISESYLAQLKTGKRNIGPSVVIKLEAGLNLDEGAFDFPLPSEISEMIDKRGADPVLEGLLLALSDAEAGDGMREYAATLPPRSALSVARIFLDRAEAALEDT